MKRLRSRAVLIATTLALVVVATGLIGVLFPRPALGAQSTLTILSGTVAVKQVNGAFGQAVDGALIQEGTTIRTGPDANAVITFFDGSTVTIDPSSEFTLQTYTVTAGGDLLADMTLTVGSTWHVVAHALTSGSKYEVHTSAATASVRGTAFTLRSVDGHTNVTTTEGTVNTASGGSSVDVHPQEQTDVDTGQAPPPPVPAPPPPATVKITLDATSNAVVIDASGRSVGVQNGQPVRYVPGSKVTLENGKLVLEIPQNTPGRLSTVVTPDAPTQGGSVQIDTQVLGSSGNVIASTVENRTVDQNGAAKGGVVITTNGVLLLPESDAQKAPKPNLGAPPPPPTQSIPTLFGPELNKPIQLLPGVVPLNNPNPQGPSSAAAPLPSNPGVGGSGFLGAFQTFTTPSGGGSGGNAPGANANIVVFTTAVPAGFIPPAPPGKTDTGILTVPPPPFVVPLIDPAGGLPIVPLVPPIPPGIGIAPVTGGTPTGPFTTGTAPFVLPPSGCRSDTVFGVACGGGPAIGITPITPPGGNSAPPGLVVPPFNVPPGVNPPVVVPPAPPVNVPPVGNPPGIAPVLAPPVLNPPLIPPPVVVPPIVPPVGAPPLVPPVIAPPVAPPVIAPPVIAPPVVPPVIAPPVAPPIVVPPVFNQPPPVFHPPPRVPTFP